MIVITRKNILNFISSVSMVVILAVFINIFALKNKNNAAVPTVNLPVTNKVIVIDAGHGVPDEGKNLLTPTE